MGMNVLITGGAGFIGSHLADELLRAGHRVRALDLLIPQVHGAARARPAYLDGDVELIVGDVCDPATVARALEGIDAVFHFAAAVGVGQSMYEVAHYTRVNNLGTAVLLERLVEHPVERLVVASSMSIYGEGRYRTADGAPANPPVRAVDQLRRGQWELLDELGRPLQPTPTAEDKTPQPTSVYALSKYDQERLALMVGEAYGIPAVALRFFNVYGPRQALSNPYTGVLAIFASRYLNGNPPLIFEDGRQQRDFVSVHDVARACRLAMEAPRIRTAVLNIGSGEAITVSRLAERIAEVLHRSDVTAQITHRYRVGDVRHCYADIARARQTLGYEPRVQLDEGLEELAGWLDGQVADDRVHAAHEELAARGLTL